MTNKNASTPNDGDTQLAAGMSSTTLAETGEVEIAGRSYVTDRRLAGLLNVTTRTLVRWNGTRTEPSAAPGPDSV
jgi:hypothetical protein